MRGWVNLSLAGVVGRGRRAEAVLGRPRRQCRHPEHLARWTGRRVLLRHRASGRRAPCAAPGCCSARPWRCGPSPTCSGTPTAPRTGSTRCSRWPTRSTCSGWCRPRSDWSSTRRAPGSPGLAPGCSSTSWCSAARCCWSARWWSWGGGRAHRGQLGRLRVRRLPGHRRAARRPRRTAPAAQQRQAAPRPAAARRGLRHVDLRRQRLRADVRARPGLHGHGGRRRLHAGAGPARARRPDRGHVGRRPPHAATRRLRHARAAAARPDRPGRAGVVRGHGAGRLGRVAAGRDRAGPDRGTPAGPHARQPAAAPRARAAGRGAHPGPRAPLRTPPAHPRVGGRGDLRRRPTAADLLRQPGRCPAARLGARRAAGARRLRGRCAPRSTTSAWSAW